MKNLIESIENSNNHSKMAFYSWLLMSIIGLGFFVVIYIVELTGDTFVMGIGLDIIIASLLSIVFSVIAYRVFIKLLS